MYVKRKLFALIWGFGYRFANYTFHKTLTSTFSNISCQRGEIQSSFDLMVGRVSLAHWICRLHGFLPGSTTLKAASRARVSDLVLGLSLETTN